MSKEISEADFMKQEVKFVEWSKEAKTEDYDVRQILARIREIRKDRIDVLDVGGGIGLVGALLAESQDNVFVDVVDNSILAKQNFMLHDRLQLIFDDFLNVDVGKTYDVIIFRTVLHHIIDRTSKGTLEAQNKALKKAGQLLEPSGKLIVIENFYEPFVTRDITGEIIFQCTKQKMLAPLFRSLGANTAGEGVRFRSYQRWMEIFNDNNFEISGDKLMEQWNVPLPLWQRMPVLCKQKYQALVELKKIDA